MRRVLISDVDWALTGSFSGGSWDSAGPLSNLINGRPTVVARAANTDPTQTFIIDLGDAVSIGAVFLANLITTDTATVQVEIATDSGFTSVVYDSTAVSTRPQDAGGSYGEAEFLALGRTRVFVPDAPVTGQYVRVTIVDSDAVIPVQLGCISVCSVYEASINPKYGASITPIDESEVTRTPFGASYFTKRGMRHRANFGWDFLEQSEAFTQLMRIVREKGTTTPLVVVLFSDDFSTAIGLERTSLYGTISTASPLTFAFFEHYSAALQIDQLI